MRLGRIGFDNVVGYLKDGMLALETRAELVGRLDRLTAATLAEQLACTEPPLVVDVRAAKEWEGDHIDGSINLPLHHLRERASELPRDRPLVVHCATGYRSSIACSLLEQQGFENMADLVGGIKAWQSAGLPTSGAPTQVVG